MGAYMNALREEGTREELLAEIERQQARAERAEADAAALRLALESAEEWLDATLSPCEPDCDCVLHTVQRALAATDAGAALAAEVVALREAVRLAIATEGEREKQAILRDALAAVPEAQG